MTKKPSSRNKEWEKERRDRLNTTFNDLAKLLPLHNTNTVPSKIEILQHSIKFIVELQRQIRALQTEFGTGESGASGQVASNEHDVPKENENVLTVEKPKRKYSKRKPKAAKEDELEQKTEAEPKETTEKPQSVPEPVLVEHSKPAPEKAPKKSIRTRKERLLLKARLFKRIKQQVLESIRKRGTKLRRKSNRLKLKQGTTHEQEKLIDDQLKLNKNALEELIIPPMNPELFVSLPAISPTEVFLINFPMVSGGQGNSGKGADVADPVVQQLNVHQERLPGKIEQTALESSKTALLRMPPQFPAPAPLLDPTFDTFSFALTATTHTSHGPQSDVVPMTKFQYPQTTIEPPRVSNLLPSIPSAPSGPSLSTETQTTSSWSYNSKKKTDAVAPPFSFSLSTTAQTPTATVNVSNSVAAKSPPAEPLSGRFNSSASSTTQISCSASPMVFDGYNPNTFNSFLLPAIPPAPDCQFGSNSSNSFSFRLTPTTSAQEVPRASAAPVNYTMDPPFVTPPKKAPKPLYENAQPQQLRKDKGSAVKKTTSSSTSKKIWSSESGSASGNNKSHVNWMTDSTHNYHSSGSGEQQSIFSAPIQTCNTYLAPPASVFKFGEDYQKSDLFFAHPPGDEPRFLWSQPPSMDIEKPMAQTDFGVAGTLIHPPPPAVQSSGGPAITLPSSSASSMHHNGSPVHHVPGKQSATVSSSQSVSSNDQQHYQPNGHDFSVCNLVGSGANKKSSNNQMNHHIPNGLVETGSGGKWRPAGNWDGLESYNRIHVQESQHHSSSMHGNRPPPLQGPMSNSKSYSAEALIANQQSYPSSNVLSSGMERKRQNSFYVSDCLAGGPPPPSAAAASVTGTLSTSTSTIIGHPGLVEGVESDHMDYTNLLNNGGGVGQRAESSKIHSQGIVQDPSTNHYPYFSNDFMQSSMFPPPPPPLSDHNSAALLKPRNQATIPKGTNKRKGANITGDQLGFNPVISGHPPNYDISPNFFSIAEGQCHSSVPVAPSHSFLINSDAFNYSGAPHPPPPPHHPPLDFHVSNAGSNSFSGNFLPNFNLSSICPEINHPIS